MFLSLAKIGLMRLVARLVVSVVLLGALVFSLASTAQAQQAISPSIGVSPVLVRRDVLPGKSQQIKITLTNYGADPIPLQMVKSTITSIADDGSPVFSNQVSPQSATNWLSFDQSDVILPPNISQDVTATITPPADAAPGGYNAALQFQAKLPSYYFDLDANARVLPALSVSILLTIGTAQETTMADLKINHLDTPSIVLSSPIPVISEVNNPTNFFIFTDGQLTLQPMFGSKKMVTDLHNSVILPTSSRKYINAYSGALSPGIYTAILQLQQGDKVLVASARFVAFPWQYLVVLFLIIALILGFLGRNRFRQAARVLAGR